MKKNKRNIPIIIGIFALIKMMQMINRIVFNCFDSIVVEKLKQIDKYKGYYLLHEEWVRIHQKGMDVSDYFMKKDVREIAIYGYGKLGHTFYDEIKNSEIKVKYYIDKNSKSFLAEIPVFSLKDNLPKVDLIVVTIPEQLDQIQREIKERADYPVVSLETVIYGI